MGKIVYSEMVLPKNEGWVRKGLEDAYPSNKYTIETEKWSKDLWEIKVWEK